jgi:hypothetical protein
MISITSFCSTGTDFEILLVFPDFLQFFQRNFVILGILEVIKIRSTTSFGGEVKPSVPCRRFTACKRTLRALIEMFRKQNSAAISHPSLLIDC